MVICNLKTTLLSAPPKIIKLEMRQQFNWCIHYEFKGYPTPNKTWIFNGDVLIYSKNIYDSEIDVYRG